MSILISCSVILIAFITPLVFTSKERSEETRCIYDALVVYHRSDVSRVTDTLLPVFEDAVHLNLHRQNRDWLCVRDVIDNILQSIESSRKVSLIGLATANRTPEAQSTFPFTDEATKVSRLDRPSSWTENVVEKAAKFSSETIWQFCLWFTYTSPCVRNIFSLFLTNLMFPMFISWNMDNSSDFINCYQFCLFIVINISTFLSCSVLFLFSCLSAACLLMFVSTWFRLSL